MDELFGNLIYLIPIAIVIFRVISAAQGQSKKNQPQKKPSGEPLGKTREVRENVYENAPAVKKVPPGGQQSGPVRAQALVPSWPDTRKKPAAKISKPPAKPKPAQPKQGEYRSLFPGAFPESAPIEAGPAGQQQATALAEQAAEPKSTAGVTASGSLPGVSAGLTPLQQAFVWSEILGAPKSEQGF
ncbi:MAG: hypothetical protein LBK74_08635 [Treponema sp.]|jgi:hypothetical protein|nr:hypothetical protein [Treponema sp.]